MKSLRSGVAAAFALVLCLSVASPQNAASQEQGDVNRGFYVGTMIAVPFSQKLYHRTSVSGMAVSADLELDYGIGFAAVAGNRISDYLGVELTGTWSRQSSDLGLPLPPALAGAASGVSLAYAGTVTALQSKLDLLLYPVRVPITSSGAAEPYVGGGAGVVRSDIDMDLVLNDRTRAITGTPAGGLIPGKVSSKATDFQMSLRAGVNVPFDRLGADLGWQFYRTYNEGKNSNSHVLGLVIKYAL